MIDDSNDIAAYYNNDPEVERSQRWLDLLYEISAEESILGASRHLLHIGRKKWL